MTVAFAGIVAAIVFLTGILLALVSVGSVRTQAQAGADMAALAGADISSVAVFEAASNPALPCVQAAVVAEQNNLVIEQCWVEGPDTFVVAGRDLRILLWDLPVRARARAGSLQP